MTSLSSVGCLAVCFVSLGPSPQHLWCGLTSVFSPHSSDVARFEKVVAALTLLHLSAFCCRAGLALQLLKMTKPEGCFPPAAPWVDHHPWGAGGSARLFPVPGVRGWAAGGHCLPDGGQREVNDSPGSAVAKYHFQKDSPAGSDYLSSLGKAV